ncbi:phospholipase A2-like [Peromyscus californicus insignis]|uniref:phospholipase A2-like n=1 Tax=Peromyscus californicus insignis TaxID=564181 RepID=UPI0022A69E4B|nr:phospholipase A2-like [Peromyscus californicus insignis]
MVFIQGRAGPNAHSISPQAVWQFNNAFKCTTTLIEPFSDYSYYGCYCGLLRFGDPDEDLDRCCQTHDHCYAQIKKLENCKFFIRNPYTSLYLDLCSGNEITCSDKNNPCEAFICNCDCETAICFSQAPYNKNYKGKYC